MLRLLTAGESHGPAVLAVVDGLPAGLPLDTERIDRDLARRRAGPGRGPRMELERDRVQVLGGAYAGRTTGAPLALLVPNRGRRGWRLEDGPAPDDEPDAAPLTRPRPGHADLAGWVKYGFSDLIPVMERASARETAARCAAGSVARLLLEQFGVTVLSHIVAIGDVTADITARDGLAARWATDPKAAARAADESPLRCLDAAALAPMSQAIEAAADRGDTLGGAFEVVAVGLPPGLGSHVQWDRRLDGLLAQALMSVPGVRGVEVGAGFSGCRLPGSKFHDPMIPGRGGAVPGITRDGNNAGGLEGGMTNGEPLVLRAAMKPIPTLGNPLPTVDLATGGPAEASRTRSDVCAVPAAAVVGEAVCALTLAAALLDKFGGDALEDVKAAVAAYRGRLGSSCKSES